MKPAPPVTSTFMLGEREKYKIKFSVHSQKFIRGS
jgi:hypothetical protein